MKKREHKKGFTLIELMVVIVIIGILATLGLVSFQNALRRSRNAKASSDLKDIAAAAEQVKALAGISGAYPQIGSDSSPYSCLNAISDFTMPSSASSNAYRCRQAASGGSFCLSVQLEGSNDGNCTAHCTSATAYTAGAGNYYCVRSKQ